MVLFVFLLSSMLKRMTKGLYETMIKAKIYMRHVNFTERRAWFVNVWTSLRCDLPPKVNVTHNCLLSTRENLMISLKTFMQEERFEVPLSFTWRVNFSNNRTWNEISIRPSLPPPTFLPSQHGSSKPRHLVIDLKGRDKNHAFTSQRTIFNLDPTKPCIIFTIPYLILLAWFP